MEEFKSFVEEKVKKQGRMYFYAMIGALAVGFLFWSYYLYSEIGSITVPRIFIIIGIFSPFLFVIFLYSWLKSKKPESNAIWKLLFETPEKMVNMSVVKNYNNYTVRIKKTNKLYTGISFQGKEEAQKFINYMKEHFPKVEMVK